MARAHLAPSLAPSHWEARNAAVFAAAPSAAGSLRAHAFLDAIVHANQAWPPQSRAGAQRPQTAVETACVPALRSMLDARLAMLDAGEGTRASEA